MSELCILTLALRPLAVTPAPPLSGLLARRLFLEAIQDQGGVLEGIGQRSPGGLPYTVSELGGADVKEPLDPAREYALRFTALTPAVAAALELAGSGGRLSQGRELLLGDIPFRVERIEAESTDYQQLGGPWLLGERRPANRFAIRLISPSTFARGAHYLPVPLPGLVFGGLLERWNTFAPVALPAEVAAFAEEGLVLSSYRLSTRRMMPGDAGLLSGAVGVVRYSALRPERYFLSVFSLLLSFARFAGVGAATELGMGQCECEFS